jgi:Family of unknown function (DUF5519)
VYELGGGDRSDARINPTRTRKSHWIELRFTTPADLERVIELVELAIENM